MTDIEKLRKQKIIPALRRISRWWPYKAQALKLAKISPGQFKCAQCKDVFPQKKIQVDHIKPIIPVKDGFTNWDAFIVNLFCDVTNLQILCENCHKSKSMTEQQLRKQYRKKKK